MVKANSDRFLELYVHWHLSGSGRTKFLRWRLVSQWFNTRALLEQRVDILSYLQHVRVYLTSNLDPKSLSGAHVVVTTYDVVKSEYDSYNPSTKNMSKSKTKSKTPTNADGDDSDTSDNFGRTVMSKTVKSKTTRKKDALFRVRWWRIVLGIVTFFLPISALTLTARWSPHY